MMLAERGAFLGGKVWVREIRKLTSTGKQMSIVATNYLYDLRKIAVLMFSRWSQENFFRYMRQHFGLDSLIDYRLEDVCQTTRVVNPQYRDLSGKIRSKNSILARKQAEYGVLSLDGAIDKANVDAYVKKKMRLKEEIDELNIKLAQLKLARKAIPTHIAFKELPESEKFKRLSTPGKHFIDTIKMICLLYTSPSPRD